MSCYGVMWLHLVQCSAVSGVRWLAELKVNPALLPMLIEDSYPKPDELHIEPKRYRDPSAGADMTSRFCVAEPIYMTLDSR